ncbi:MAG: hypothetical protein GT589_01035 [Peptoclostridium sp.]|uniref:DNA primase family protein n=1 Tax=Peptoclostridium sp. TaxID=1904860 RepID=UPI00139DBDB5|nr:phage/plasmid primase, P4 family [Peptoclostridium sp.]MZQ74728.1 hypothetical protein [Peptoclostridium sp.]
MPDKKNKNEIGIEDYFKEHGYNIDYDLKKTSSVRTFESQEEEDFIKSHNESGPLNDSNKSIVEYDVYKKVIKRYRFKVHNEDIYSYSEELGYFKKLTLNEVRVLIRNGWGEKIEMLLNKHRVDDVIDRIKGCRDLQITSNNFDMHDDFINFRNKVFCVSQGKTYEHSPEYNFKSFIDAEYREDMKKKDGRAFMNFIATCTGGNEAKVDLIQEICGYVFSNYSRAKKFFVFIGKPHTGKSTFLDILKEIVGGEYTTAIPLHKLGDRFMTASLFEAKLNISGELYEGELKGLNTIKALTGNDDVIGEKKGKDPFVFKNRSKLIFAGNSMPTLRRLDSTSAYFDRIEFVIFNNTIPEDERDLNLKEKILSERDYIVYWAMEGLRRLIKNNFVFTRCKESRKFKSQYMQEVNTVDSFIETCCHVDRDNKELKAHKRDLYNAYSKYCQDNCLASLSKMDFFRQIKTLAFKSKKFRKNGSLPLEGFCGIELMV